VALDKLGGKGGGSGGSGGGGGGGGSGSFGSRDAVSKMMLNWEQNGMNDEDVTC
jgi:hypothetical protein